MEKADNPGVYIPPPLFYVAIFLTAVFIQKHFPINSIFFKSLFAKIAGCVLILTGLFFNLPALLQFFKTKNTVITHHPALSLQTTGIYRYSRNPMYVSLFLFYLGISFLVGNWWNFIFFPILFFIVREYIVKREEKYLYRKFGQAFTEYTRQTRRWF